MFCVNDVSATSSGYSSLSSNGNFGSLMGFGSLLRQARRIEKVPSSTSHHKRSEKEVKKIQKGQKTRKPKCNMEKNDKKEEKSLKRKVNEEKMTQERAMMDLEEGKIINSDDEDKENRSDDHNRLIKQIKSSNGQVYLEIHMPEKVNLVNPEDPDEELIKLRALYGGQRSIKKSIAREFFRIAPSGPLLRK